MVRLWRRSAGRSGSAIRRDRSGQGRPALRATSKDDRIDAGPGRQTVHGGDRLRGERSGFERRPESVPLALHHRRRHVPAGPQTVAGQTFGEGQVEHDRDGRDSGRGSSPDEVEPRGGLHVRGVDDSRPGPRRAGGSLEGRVECPEGPPADRLVRLTSCPRRARNASDDSTSPGAKWRAAKVDLPEPAAPTRTTTDGSGTGRSILIDR